MTILLTFALIFVPFIWFIQRMIRYTDETIGDHSPVYSIQSYTITTSQYFGEFVHVMMLFISLMMAATFVLLIPQISRQFSVTLVLLVPVSMLGLTGFYFYFDWQYWKLVRGKTVSLDPFKPEISVEDNTRQVFLNPSTIVRFEHHVKRTNSARDIFGLYGYYVFYTVDHQAVVLSNEYFLHNEFLDRCFTAVPQTRIEHKMPWPPPTIAPNFAS